MILIGTGSEVQLAVAGPRACWPRRASAPASSRCRAASGSTSRTQAYRDTVLPPIVKARVSGRGRHRAWAGATSSATTGRIVSLEHYGASADYATIYREFGITAEAVALAAEESIADSQG